MDKISNLKTIILNTLDSNKALDIVSIDLTGKSGLPDKGPTGSKKRRMDRWDEGPSHTGSGNCESD